MTVECKLLSNEHNVRVLDTPAFADSTLTREHGVMKSNLQIFRWILQEQEKHNLAFCRVLYFLPMRGPPERAYGTLQGEIKILYEFLGKDVFNIMVIVATNRKKYQMYWFDEDDINITKRIFTCAFEKATGNPLPKCPPIIYAPLHERDAINRVAAAQVIADEALKMKASDQPKKDKGSVVTYGTQEMLIDDKKNPGKKLQFQGRCTRCAGKLIYEDSPTGRRPVKIVYESGGEVPLEESKCHPIFIPKHYTITKITGGIAHIATLGPGFTNSDEICPVCGLSPGSEGCSAVGNVAEVLMKENKIGYMKTSHSTALDKFQLDFLL